jgi:NCAIR mutase (PurE)-related protein
MNDTNILHLAHQFTGGELTAAQFLDALAAAQTGIVPDAAVDLDRQRRCGFAEVVYAPGKSVEAVLEICRRLKAAAQPILVTRLSPEQGAALAAEFPDGLWHARGRTFRRAAIDEPVELRGFVPVVSAGTSDLPVAEEAAETLTWMQVKTEVFADLGVAGPQRLQQRLPELRTADAIVVVAGMEGALPSVVGGHVSCPVIAVPTSVGYGASFGGVAALLGMLNSCAANVTVVNIDAGFKAGFVAGLIARQKR